MADCSSSKTEHDSDSDSSFFSDLDEFDLLRPRRAEELEFVDGYFHQEGIVNGIPGPSFENSSYNFNDTTNNEDVNLSSLKPWDRFADWVHCVCVVTFDLEIGQMIEVIAFIVKQVSNRDDFFFVFTFRQYILLISHYQNKIKPVSAI